MSDEFVNNEEALKDYQANAFRTPDGYTSDILLFAMKEKKTSCALDKAQPNECGRSS